MLLLFLRILLTSITANDSLHYMGWIHNKHMQSGGSIGGRSGKHKGPLRKVIEITQHGQGMFSTDRGILECGHVNNRITIGAARARCRECGKLEPGKYQP